MEKDETSQTDQSPEDSLGSVNQVFRLSKAGYPVSLPMSDIYNV